MYTMIRYINIAKQGHLCVSFLSYLLQPIHIDPDLQRLQWKNKSSIELLFPMFRPPVAESSFLVHRVMHCYLSRRFSKEGEPASDLSHTHTHTHFYSHTTRPPTHSLSHTRLFVPANVSRELWCCCRGSMPGQSRCIIVGWTLFRNVLLLFFHRWGWTWHLLQPSV